MVVHVEVPVAEVELAADQLLVAGANAVEERDQGDGTVVLVADCDPPVGFRWRYQVVEVVDHGLDGWRPYASAVRAAPRSRLVIRPPWVAPLADARPDDLELAIDPGHAFGSGSHPTTRLVLHRIEHHLAVPADGPTRSLLDVGCGSGVLAIGAARLGAAPVVGIDIDPAAVEATLANAEANGCGPLVQASATPLDAVAGTFALVVANLSAATIAANADDLAARVDADGALVLSGLLVADQSPTEAAFAGWATTWVGTDEGWAAIELHRAG